MKPKNSLKQMVYDGIVTEITRGIYAPGTIITESALIEKFNVSKAPVREALIELCKDDYVQSLPRMGYQIVPYTLKETIDILDFRLDLEVCNLKRAFSVLNPEKIQKFQTDISKLTEIAPVTKDISENWSRNQQFHLLICALSENKYIYKELERILKQNARFFAQYYTFAWNHKKESEGKYHQAIANAIVAKDTLNACRYLYQDIYSVKQRIQELVSGKSDTYIFENSDIFYSQINYPL